MVIVDAVIFVTVACAALLVSSINAMTLFRVRAIMSSLEATMSARNKELAEKRIELQKQTILILELSRLISYVMHPGDDHDPSPAAKAEARNHKLYLLERVARAEQEVSIKVFPGDIANAS